MLKDSVMYDEVYMKSLVLGVSSTDRIFKPKYISMFIKSCLIYYDYIGWIRVTGMC
jgi:hypothetical protein